MLRLLFYTAASFIMTFINLPFDYTNGFELLWGNILTSIFLSIINFAFYKIAYFYVGWYAVLTEADYAEKSLIHWFIRFILAISLYALTYVPIISNLLTGIIHASYSFLLNKYHEYIHSILEAFMNLT